MSHVGVPMGHHQPRAAHQADGMDYDNKLRRIIQKASKCDRIYDETFYTIKEALEHYLQQLTITASRFQTKRKTASITVNDILLALRGDDRIQEFVKREIEKSQKDGQK